jgi:hypothetical protein
MKKFFTVLLVSVVAMLWFTSVHGQFQTQNPYEVATDAGWVQNVNVIGQGQWQQDAFVNVVRWAINWTLGILAFIALCILLYGWFLMVTAAWDEEKYGKWFTILRQAAIGLILIGIAWFIISIVFWLVNLVGRATEWQSANTWA